MPADTVAWCDTYVDGTIIEYNGTWYIIICHRCGKHHKVAR